MNFQRLNNKQSIVGVGVVSLQIDIVIVLTIFIFFYRIKNNYMLFYSIKTKE